MKNKKVCSVINCNKIHYAKRFCKLHYIKQYNEKNKEKVKKQREKYYQKNKTNIKKYRDAYRKKNIKKITEYNKKYKQKRKEILLATKRRKT